MKPTDRVRSISYLEAMLKLLALSRKSVEAGAVRPLEQAAAAILARTRE